MSDKNTHSVTSEDELYGPWAFMWHPWFSESVYQWLLNKHRCWSGKQSEVKSWWAQKSTINQPLNQQGYFEKCAVFWSRFVFSCSELIWRLIKLECRNEETMKVSAYTGTQRTKAHEQEFPTRVQDTIMLFSGGSQLNLNSIPFWLWLRPGTEKAMAPHSSTLAWKIPWTEEPGGLQSMGSLRVRHDLATSLSLFTFMHWRRKWHPLQYSCLENPRDGGAWWAAVYGVAQSRTRLKRLSSSSRPGKCHGWRSLVGCSPWGR